MRRSVFNLVTLVSLLLCVAVCVLWVRSRVAEDRLTRVLQGDRYSLASAGGTITLWGPPPPSADPGTRRDAREVVGAIRNDQVRWVARFWSEEIPLAENDVDIFPVTMFRSAAERVERDLAAQAVTRPLLAALENPDRFVVAHALLMMKWRDLEVSSLRAQFLAGHRLGKCDYDFDERYEQTPWLRTDCGGLELTFRHWDGMPPSISVAPSAWSHFVQADVEPAQFDAVRESWHRRLDVRTARFPYWALTAATVLLPVLRLGVGARRRVRSFRRRRVGLCPRCGYDVRATTDRCPECGIEAKAAA